MSPWGSLSSGEKGRRLTRDVHKAGTLKSQKRPTNSTDLGSARGDELEKTGFEWVTTRKPHQEEKTAVEDETDSTGNCWTQRGSKYPEGWECTRLGHRQQAKHCMHVTKTDFLEEEGKRGSERTVSSSSSQSKDETDLGFEPSVLVCSGCHNTEPQTVWLTQ